MIKDKNGETLTETEKITYRWKRYCEEIYSDKMRRFAEISHIELLVSVERYGNVVYYGENSFRLS